MEEKGTRERKVQFPDEWGEGRVCIEISKEMKRRKRKEKAENILSVVSTVLSTIALLLAAISISIG